MAAVTQKRYWLMLLLICAAVHADDPKIYSWIDQAGHVHYSDQAQATAHEVKSSGSNAAQKTTGDAAIGIAVESDPRAQDCQRKREQLITYQHASKVTETDGLGKTREYTPEEKQKLIDLTQTAVSDLCGP